MIVEVSAHTLKENLKEILDSGDIIGITRHGFMGHVVIPVEVYKSMIKLLDELDKQ